MPYADRYRYYLDLIPQDLFRYRESSKSMVLGFTSDFDVLIRWDTEVFNGLLERYLEDAPSAKEGEVIKTRNDFARIVSYYTINGLGGEVEITNDDVCKCLEREFKTVPALGGTCAQGAAALGAMGFPVVAHITDRSEPVCELMDYPGVSTVLGGRLVPIMASSSSEPPVRHMILQYSKGDEILIGGVKHVVPVSNRVILDFDKIHKIVPLDPDFMRYQESRAREIASYSISGFNAIVDESICERRMSELRSHLGRIKETHPGCVVYLEGAHYFTAGIKNAVFGGLSKYVDILGMNEEELASLADDLGMEMDKDDPCSVLLCLERVIAKYPVRGIVMHTKDYAMYYGERLDGVDLEKGLTLGNLMSATRARTGAYGSQDDCRETLSVGLSRAGVEFADRLERLQSPRHVRIVPSRYLEKPACTIGLGDTFMAGMQVSFI